MTTALKDWVTTAGTILFGIGLGVLTIALRKTFEIPSGFYPTDIFINYLLTFLAGALSGWFLILGYLGTRHGPFTRQGYARTMLGLAVLVMLFGVVMIIILTGR